MSYDDLIAKLSLKLGGNFKTDFVVTKKGKLVNRKTGSIFQNSMESFGETLDRESESMTQIPLVVVFPSEDSQQLSFNPKATAFNDFSMSQCESFITNPLTDDQFPLLSFEGDKQPDLVEKVVSKLSNKKTLPADLSDPLSSSIADVDKIAGMLHIAPEIFEIDNDFHQLMLAVQKLVRASELVVQRRKTAMSFCQNQILGNEILFVSLANCYK
jgi:hypothetical protein